MSSVDHAVDPWSPPTCTPFPNSEYPQLTPLTHSPPSPKLSIACAFFTTMPHLGIDAAFPFWCRINRAVISVWHNIKSFGLLRMTPINCSRIYLIPRREIFRGALIPYVGTSVQTGNLEDGCETAAPQAQPLSATLCAPQRLNCSGTQLKPAICHMTCRNNSAQRRRSQLTIEPRTASQSRQLPSRFVPISSRRAP